MERIGLSFDNSSKGANTFINAFNIFMTDKDSSFDYATNIEQGTTTPKATKAVNYYNITGMLMKEAQKGINIRKVIYEDGTVKINKVLVK